MMADNAYTGYVSLNKQYDNLYTYISILHIFISVIGKDVFR